MVKNKLKSRLKIEENGKVCYSKTIQRRSAMVKRLVSFMMSAAIALGSILPQDMTAFASEQEQTTVSGEIEVLMNQSYESMHEYIEGFEQKYPGVKINLTYYSDYENEAGNRIQSGNYGDVLLIPGAILAENYDKYLEPLGTYQELNVKYNYMEQSKFTGDVVYGIPSFAYLSGIAYNKEVFDEAGIAKLPDNINEFIMDMQLIKEHTDAIPLYTNYTSDWAMNYWETFPYIEMTGNAGYRYNTFLYTENPFQSGTPHYEVYHLLYDLAALGCVEDNVLYSDWDKSKTMLNEGQIGCMVIGSWAVSQSKSAGPNPDNIEFMPFPNMIDGKHYMTVSTDYCYGIASNSDNKETARAFVDYMINESGYALDNDNLSVVKTDPYPDAFGSMDNVVMLSSRAPSDKDYSTYVTLSQQFQPGDALEIKHVIEAGTGMRDISFDDIMADWNTRWEASRTDEMRRSLPAQNSLMGISVFLDNSEVTLSDKEKEYVEAHPSIRVGYLKNMAPFSCEVQGQPAGLAFDLCDIIRENTGLALEYYGYENTQTAVEALKNGEIDMIASMEKLADEDKLKYSKDYFSAMNILAKQTTLDVTDLDDKKAAVVKGGQNLYEGDTANQVVYDTISDCIESVQREKTDYTVTNYYSANYYIRENECDRVDLIPSSSSSTLHLGFLGSADATLVALCNKCIYSTSQNSMQVAILKYMEPQQKPVTIRKIIETNPMLCIAVLSCFFFVVLVFVLIIMHQRKKVAVYQYREKAQRDPLTKLYNRNGFHAGLPVRSSEVLFAVLDMDNFKSVNDSLGHEGGDCALMKLARTLEADLGEKALICRYGGDEFMAFMEGIGEDEADSRLRKLVNDMDTELTYDGKTHKLSISVGAVYSETKIETEGLFKMADEVLYQTKERGKNGYHINIVG